LDRNGTCSTSSPPHRGALRAVSHAVDLTLQGRASSVSLFLQRHDQPRRGAEPCPAVRPLGSGCVGVGQPQPLLAEARAASPGAQTPAQNSTTAAGPMGRAVLAFPKDSDRRLLCMTL